MEVTIQAGQILNEYEVKKIILHDGIYCWADAIHLHQGQAVVLQVLTTEIDSGEMQNLLTYFDDLQRIKRKGLYIPETTLQDNGLLILVYQIIDGTNILEAIKDNSATQARDWWKQASELLFHVHNKKLTHGLIDERSFIIIGEQVYLRNFGYAPFLEAANKQVLSLYASRHAPELQKGGNLTPRADIFCFANLVALWQPALVDTPWYKKCIIANPEDRFRRIREAMSELEQALVLEQEIVEEENSQGSTEGSLIPKFRVTIHSEPVIGGTVTGEGLFERGTRITIAAKPAKGWRFSGWSSRLPNTATVEWEVVDEKKITAYFEKIEAALPDEVPGEQHDKPKGNFKLVVIAGLVILSVAGGWFLGQSGGKTKSSRNQPATQSASMPQPTAEDPGSKQPKSEIPATAPPSAATQPVQNQTPPAMSETMPSNIQEQAPKSVQETTRQRAQPETPKAPEAPARSVNWVTDSRAGVKLAISGAKAGETFTWSGGTSGGYADGSGTISYFKNGVLQRQVRGTWQEGHMVEGGSAVIVYPNGQVTTIVRNGFAAE